MVKKNNTYRQKSKELVEIGGKIRKKRLSKGLTMMDLSFDSDIDYRQIGRIERGETNFTIKTLLRICQSLKCSLRNIIK
jgi:transcriptional regulator with XRE-family HTH domain